MTTKDLIKELCEATNGGKDSKSIIKLEKLITRVFPEAVYIDEFYNLPFSNLTNIIKNVDICDFVECNEDKVFKMLITKMCEKRKQEAPLLLSIISNPFSTLDECMSLIGCFSQCPLCVRTYSLYEADSKQVDFDYEYEILTKDQLIMDLNKRIKELELEILCKKEMEEPSDFEPNLFEAAKQGKISSVQYLIEKNGVDPSSKSNYWQTPLHPAAQEGHLTIVRYLVEKHNVDVNDHNSGENTPLCDAAYNNHFDVVKYLVENGAKIDELGWMDESPLHKAVKAGSIPIVEYLLNMGAKKDIQNHFGKTPCQCAKTDQMRNLFM